MQLTDDGTDEDGHLSSKSVTAWTCEESTKEGSTSEYRNDSSGLIVSRGEFIVETLASNCAGNDTQIITVKD